MSGGFFFFLSQVNDHSTKQSQHYLAICTSGEFAYFAEQMFNAVSTITCAITACPGHAATQSMLNSGGY